MILKKDEMRAKFNSLSEHNHISVNKPKVLRKAALRQSWFSWGPPLKRYKLKYNLIKYSCTIHFSYDYNSLMFAERKRKERYRNWTSMVPSRHGR